MPEKNTECNIYKILSVFFCPLSLCPVSLADVVVLQRSDYFHIAEQIVLIYLDLSH